MNTVLRYTLDHSRHRLPQAVLTNSSVDIVNIARFCGRHVGTFMLISEPLTEFLRAVPERARWLAALVHEGGFEVSVGLHPTHSAVTVEVIGD